MQSRIDHDEGVRVIPLKDGTFRYEPLERQTMQPNDIKAARLSLGMSQRQLAETLRMGLDGGRAVRRWESGDRPISGPASVAIEAMLTGWRPA
jgi:DNA-binding transcriptional regulator YiaG